MFLQDKKFLQKKLCFVKKVNKGQLKDTKHDDIVFFWILPTSLKKQFPLIWVICVISMKYCALSG